MNKIITIQNSLLINKIADEIRESFLNDYEYIIIKNNLCLDNNNEIINYYSTLNNLLGEVKMVDKNKYDEKNQNDYWVDIKYSFSDNVNNYKTKIIPPWKTNEQLMLHTDNTLTNNNNFANITELICLEPSIYSGETVIISNDKIINLIKYLDTSYNTKLYENLLNTKIFHKLTEKNICFFRNNNDKNSKYTFNFNINQILSSELNSKENLETAKEFHKLLENIMQSSLLEEVRLEKGDALLFNDTLVMHGRKYVFGERFYKKCSILIT
jgi:hypothetical protein